MGTQTIHSRKLLFRLYSIGPILGSITGGFATLFTLQIVRLDHAQLIFLAQVLAALATLSMIVYYALLRRIFAPVANYFREGNATTPNSTMQHNTLYAANRIPRQLALLGSSIYPLIGLALFVAAKIQFPYIETLSWTLAMLDILGLGFLSQMVIYVAAKQTLQPLRKELATAVSDPDIRDRLAPWFPLTRKILITMIALALISITIVATISQTRNRLSVENMIGLRQEKTLLSSKQEGNAQIPPTEILQLAQTRFQLFEIEFALLDVKTMQLVEGSSGMLFDYEVAAIHDAITSGSDSGNSRSWSTPHIFSWQDLGAERGFLIASSTKTRVLEETKASRSVIVFFAVTVCLLTLVTALFAAQDIRDSMQSLRAHIAQIASGDLSRGDTFESEDEFGKISRSLDKMSIALRNTLVKVSAIADRVDQTVRDVSVVSHDVSSVTSAQYEDIRGATHAMGNVVAQSDGITASSDSLSQSIEESNSAAVEIRTVAERLHGHTHSLSTQARDSKAAIQNMILDIQNIARRTDQLSGAVTEASNNLDAMVRQIERIDQNAAVTSTLSREVMTAATQGCDQVAQTIESMNTIQSATQKAQDVIRELGAHTTNIGEIISVIHNVADQTNLLALNAAIISAQAGEHGRAFAVVSDEIKNLAERVATNAKEIGSLVHGLQTQSGHAIEMISQGVENVAHGVELSRSAGVALERITGSAQKSHEQIDGIAALVREHTRLAADAAAFIERVSADARSIHQASESQTRAANTVLHVSETLEEMTHTVGVTTEQQGQSTTYIAKNLENVKEEVTGIHEALREQFEACKKTETLLAALLERTQENENSTKRMDSAMQNLANQSEALRASIQGFKF